ncbi:nuclear protein UL24 [Equid gammaherpesvirus 5]|uniref:Nuclear protein UL24 n=1 Tax=Equid gammaherpesvirus 5 TaxID=10371 RepID=A0A0B4Q609_9GAMA|nr:nuclear protein UL24 [Equid gammaherpesvirus 5]AIU39545.1 nuclear protein UL24 [Equid gammaherpesvirus 5]APT43417.1 nuclear protein UL24 [Equid gammaherpesvirus 5]UTK45429.1 nuclear protein UL24 [Equid gammaherpesvirus 5]UTK45509.1 nuclear protein UL24 [Equid gammaherpesvirus 5]UTK45587.1 nuclear protein UL24 [Equid gammaherpesvirus 5]
MALTFKVDTSALSKLPPKRKIAGQKAHLEMYKKLSKYASVGSLLKFLAIDHPCPTRCDVKIFFEVCLGHRIADCVILLSCGETRMCYIIELKTCMSDSTSMFNETRLCQRSQGLCQLSDALKFISYNAPSGRQKWHLVPHLIFKTQRGLKTLYTETPQFTTNIIHSSTDKLASFFFARGDRETLERVRRRDAPSEKKMAAKPRLLVTEPKTVLSRRQRLIERNKKARFKAQAKRAREQGGARQGRHA